MRAFKVILILIISTFSGIKSSAQVTRQTTSPIRHDPTSVLPDSIRVVGYLVDTPSRGMCGVFCMGGTIKIKLKEKIPGYNYQFAYLVTACLGTNITKGKLFDVIATKLKRHESECYYFNISNAFDSNGIPFYKLSERETAKIN
jgi:hypothetical protein